MMNENASKVVLWLMTKVKTGRKTHPRTIDVDWMMREGCRSHALEPALS